MSEKKYKIDIGVANKIEKITTLPLSDLKTGDIVLCHSNEKKPPYLDPGLDGVIEFFTHGLWCHAGIIVKNPWWIKEECLCILQSGNGPNGYPDIMNGNVAGVTLNYLSDFLQNREDIYVRQLENFSFDEDNRKIFKKAFDTAHGKPYDSNPCSWCWVGITSFLYCACCSRICVPRTEKTFWCSALVAFIYVEMGWFDPATDWSNKTPEDLVNAVAQDPFRLGELKKIKD